MPRTYLAFDYGSKRTGLAVGNDLTRTTQALPALNTRTLQQADGTLVLDTLRPLIKEWRIDHLVFGLPLDAQGQDTKLSRKITRLGEQLSAALELPVSYADERYTSGEADRLLRETQGAGKKFNAKKIALRDSVAAQLILETYFSHTD